MATEDILKSLVETMQVYRESHDQRSDRIDRSMNLIGDKIELLAGTLSEVNSTIREFTAITRQQGNAIQELITLAQQQQANSAKQQEAIDRLLARN
jgi:methyl-accepting chemotaxis protein